MLCSNCGHDNPPDTTFCFKCVQQLSAGTKESNASRRVLVAPQDDLLTAAHRATPPKPHSFLPELLSWLLALIALALLAYVLWL